MVEPEWNEDRLCKAVEALLAELCPKWYNDENLYKTPERVTRMYAEMLGGHEFEFTVSENTKGYDEVVLVKNIPFTSICMHHLLPFAGEAAVAYIPDKAIAGLSKLARTVEHFARRLQLQENMTQEIVDYLEKALHPQGIAVIITAEHFCMRGRGVRKPGVATTTSCIRGVFREDGRAREELMFLLGG
jgi:GTP cyclohydrolase I